jgi:hypothetical protein
MVVQGVIGLAVPGRPIRSLVAENRSTRWRQRPDGTEPLVRAGSVPQRSTTGIGGHQRLLMVRRNRRSPALQLMQLGGCRRAVRIVVPKVEKGVRHPRLRERHR